MIDFMPKLISISNVYAVFLPLVAFSVVVCGLQSLGGWLLTRIMTLAIFGASHSKGAIGRRRWAGPMSFNCQERIIIPSGATRAFTEPPPTNRRPMLQERGNQKANRLFGTGPLSENWSTSSLSDTKRSRNNVNQEPWNRIERENNQVKENQQILSVIIGVEKTDLMMIQIAVIKARAEEIQIGSQEGEATKILFKWNEMRRRRRCMVKEERSAAYIPRRYFPNLKAHFKNTSTKPQNVATKTRKFANISPPGDFNALQPLS